LFGFGVLSLEQAGALMSVVVAGGFSGFRSAIESTGYKTFIISAVMVVFAALGQFFGLIPTDKLLIIEGILTAGGVATLVHAAAKTGEPSAANKLM
jgi:hypothetical protein